MVFVGSDWSSQSHDKMEELLAEGSMCTFLARRGDSYLVEMCYNGEASLQEALVQAGVAKLTRKSSQVSHSSQGRTNYNLPAVFHFYHTIQCTATFG